MTSKFSPWMILSSNNEAGDFICCASFGSFSDEMKSRLGKYNLPPLRPKNSERNALKEFQPHHEEILACFQGDTEGLFLTPFGKS